MGGSKKKEREKRLKQYRKELNKIRKDLEGKVKKKGKLLNTMEKRKRPACFRRKNQVTEKRGK